MLSWALNRLPNSISQGLTAAYFRLQKVRTVGLTGYHSNQDLVKLIDMDIHILPALQDNYMYLIIDSETRDAAIVDPVNPDTVIQAVNDLNCNLTKILTTHNHWDHAGGNEKLVKKFQTKLTVYGGDDIVEGLTDKVNENDSFNIGKLNVTCISTPCHTKGDICYYIVSPNNERAVFTGDTLFQGGCGRFFQGTAENMYTALLKKLALLPNDTKVFCGHEYTLKNLQFALQVEPDNKSIIERIKWAEQRRNENKPTIPSTIGDEKEFNPFMRVDIESVQNYAGTNDPITTMAKIRKEKDNF